LTAAQAITIQVASMNQPIKGAISVTLSVHPHVQTIGHFGRGL